MHKLSTLSEWYVYPAALIIGLPLLCSCVVIITTFFDARQDTQTWRAEFQRALDTLCPAEQIDIEGGRGRVYLDAYLYDYQWTDGDITCQSNGRTIGCNCSESEQSIDVSKYAAEEE